MRKSRSSNQGFSLIEMLVGLLITSFGLLGLVALQARAMQLSVGSEDAQRATLLASEMAAIMFNSNTVDVSPAVVKAWAARVADTSAKGVPNGIGTVTATDATKARITVTWSFSQSGRSAGDTHQYLTDVVIPR
ncbi:type IV pilus assembly protein PilV [Pelomonas saccharophila]|uniref:Type IV pilus assembly protein PilV n=1 Tax=Roseateles saccharophilus TaxID=304 RepID=A0ABU1YR31_ROSSA|nr:prepilin-type N-terminal cleavage/methylation domain-containing protein [Roseateles saccharophilus]MDR7271320.1 type IV pilus assembly protein PilV [Roseateles saccharophilus]